MLLLRRLQGPDGGAELLHMSGALARPRQFAPQEWDVSGSLELTLDAFQFYESH
jgi:hypothetical protein